MPAKSRYGMLECEHDTPTKLHDDLWRVYSDNVDGPPKLRKIAGPFHKEITIEMGRKRTIGWVIIDLKESYGPNRDAEIDKVHNLERALQALGTLESPVDTRFYELTDSTPP